MAAGGKGPLRVEPAAAWNGQAASRRLTQQNQLDDTDSENAARRTERRVSSSRSRRQRTPDNGIAVVTHNDQCIAIQSDAQHPCNNVPMATRLYDLSSSWTFPNTQQEVWEVIADPNMAWPEWWPGCTMGKPLEREPGTDTTNNELLLASTATLNFKASLGYTLSVTYHPTYADAPNEVRFDAGGDLAGEGRVALSSTRNGQTKLDIEWRVRPTSRWMAFLSPVARPAFTYAHAALMRRGEAGLREYLVSQTDKN